MRFSKRTSNLGTETAFEVLSRARALEDQGRDVVHLEIGEPDLNTNSEIVEAAVKALRDGHHHYTPSSGILPLRQSIADEISISRDIKVDPDEVVVTPGAKPIIFFSLLALAQKGDEVIYPDPGFPIYESMIRYVGARPVPVPLREELDFRMDIEELIAAYSKRTRLVILNSPNNPTGSVLNKEDLSAIVQAFIDTDVFFLSDEVYNRIIYDDTHHSIASFPGMRDRTILIDGFSKTYAMTGWRLGYGVMNKRLSEQITKLMVNSNSCTAAFTQLAGIKALKQDQSSVKQMVKVFQKRRDLIVNLLNKINGITCRLPKGAFYVFPNIRDLDVSSDPLAEFLLQNGDVALLSGTAFGSFGEGYLRLSYATSTELIEKGVQKIELALKRR